MRETKCRRGGHGGLECVLEGALEIACSQGYLESERAEAATGPEMKGWHRGRAHRMAHLPLSP